MAKKTPILYGDFNIGNTGYNFTVEGWFPDPEVVEAEIIKVSNRLEDMEEPLTESVGALIYSTEQYFYHEKDPYGIKWEELNASYERFKELHGKGSEKILVFDGPLKEAATSPEAWDIVGNDIIFNVDELPKNERGDNYGAAHQAGTYEKGQGVGLGMGLPQRMFVGADEKAIAEIEAIFQEWIDGLIVEFAGEGEVPGLGSGFTKHGEFPVIGYTKHGQPRVAGGQFGSKTPK